MSRNIQYILILFYILLAITTGIEGNVGKVTYWIGAIILSIGVLIMK